MADHITVTGNGAANAAPDCVAVQVRVEFEAESVTEALATCSEKVAAALSAADEAGVGTRDRQTTTIGVHQRYDNEGRKVVGHTAFQSFTLRVRERDRVGDLLSTLATTAGDSLRIEGVSLELSDPTALQELAREAAFADARTRADHYARLAGRELGRVREVSEGAPPAGPMPRFALMARESAPVSMPIEAGESAVSQSVTVTWALTKQPKPTMP